MSNSEAVQKHTRTKKYLELSQKAYEKYPDNSDERLKYITENGCLQDYNSYAACILKNSVCEETIEIVDLQLKLTPHSQVKLTP